MVSNERVFPDNNEISQSITKTLIKGLLTRQLKDINEYTRIIIQLENIDELYVYEMTEDFKKVAANIDDEYYEYLLSIFDNSIQTEYYSEGKTVKTKSIYLIKPNTSGGKKAVVKYTVKQLQAIASKNNIKITKKVDGKTVRLNKQGLIAKLKRYKLI
jgi:hypothetical protein